MKSIAISGSLRENVGKKDAKELRYAGKVPCVLYGGKEQIHFSVSADDLRGLVYTPETVFIDFDIDGKKYKAAMQDIQFHPLTDLIRHIDFLEVFDNKPIMLRIPVRVDGNSPGVRMGGRLVQKLKFLKIKGLPAKHQDEISVNVDTLELGQIIRVRDIKIEGLEILNAKADTVVSVVSTRQTRQAGQEG
jgi:large subunit ribosomal protein L25